MEHISDNHENLRYVIVANYKTNSYAEEQDMVIKYATEKDITAIAAVEAECFPPSEAATAREFVERVKYYGNWERIYYSFR